MPNEQNSFQDLVAKAPPAPSEGPVSLVGTLARSKDDAKFVLILSDGRSVTLNTADVKSHTVLGNSLGLNLVQVEVDADVVRDLNFSGVRPGSQKIPGGDVHKSLIADKMWQDRPLKPEKDPITERVKELAEYIDPYGNPVYPGYGNQVNPGQTGIAPFGLATPQQAPPQVLAFFHQAAISKVTGDRTGSYQDYTGAAFDANFTGLGDYHKVQADPAY
jgi:hypothetical protein